VLVAVAVGGAAGSCLRVGAGELAPWDRGTFPWTTFAVNVVGCALLALLPRLDVVREHPLLPPMLGTGLLGGFTTLSTWSHETVTLLRSGHTTIASTYAVLTLVCCLGVVALMSRVTDLAQRAVFDAEEGDL
jgi:CrcB protein